VAILRAKWPTVFTRHITWAQTESFFLFGPRGTEYRFKVIEVIPLARALQRSSTA
jgi:hypothetical protein